MSKFDFRVFISYRGESDGKGFAFRLYEHLNKDPFCEKRYGKIYYSPKTKSAEVNFKKDIDHIMQSVEYFIMPLTENYYSDFWDKKNKCPHEDSITYKEIMAAIKNHCRFVCVSFPGFVVDPKSIKMLFGEFADELLCVEPLEYDETNELQIFEEIREILQKDEQKARGMSVLLNDLTPNVFLSAKEETEDKSKYPFYEKLNDVTKITLLNFASSSFISGIDIASSYEISDTLKNWFNHNLVNGNIEANVIITNPHSYAAHDAALFKMYPSGLTTDKDEIILTNMNKLFSFMHKYPKAKLNVYLTDIVLPYAVMITEHKDKSNNHIKIDLYSPVISDDKMRPSFYMLQNNPSTKRIYSFFEENVKNIMNNYSFRYKGHPDTKWLLNKSIIHRGAIHPGLQAHTQEAYDACIAAKNPIEVDLLLLSDGTVVVGRKEEKIFYNGLEKRLGDCTKKDLREHNKTAGNKKVFTLDDFLEYINGKIPVLLEIKDEIHSEEQTEIDKKTEYVKNILNIVQKHFKRISCEQYINNEIISHKIAFHSSDPYVLKVIKNADCMIPCGIISMDFSRVKDKVGEKFCRLHAKKEYFDMFTPDFVSYNVNDLNNMIIKNLCKKHNIPLLGWTVIDEDMQQQAYDYGCDNIIIEGSKTYL